MIFIDYSKAFDNVSHSQLFNILWKMEFPKHIIVLLKQLYTDQSAVIRGNNAHSDSFSQDKGVRQECILSPHLFNVYTEQIMREVDIEELGVTIRRKRISNQRFADDTVLIENRKEMNGGHSRKEKAAEHEYKEN